MIAKFKGQKLVLTSGRFRACLGPDAAEKLRAFIESRLYRQHRKVKKEAAKCVSST